MLKKIPPQKMATPRPNASGSSKKAAKERSQGSSTHQKREPSRNCKKTSNVRVAMWSRTDEAGGVKMLLALAILAKLDKDHSVRKMAVGNFGTPLGAPAESLWEPRSRYLMRA
jgi:hypothetical protein